jgi:F-type H+-transporting ATPase subunit b
MNINLTLLGQTITFIVFVWFCMKFIWPPLTRVLEARKQTIADGLAAAEKGRHELELAEKRALEVIKKAKADAAEVIAAAEKRAAHIADEAKTQAKVETDRIVHAARAEIDQEIARAREHLRATVAKLAVAGAAKVLEKEIDEKAHTRLLEAVVKEL